MLKAELDFTSPPWDTLSGGWLLPLLPPLLPLLLFKERASCCGWT